MYFIDSFWIDAGTARFYAKHSLKYVPSSDTWTVHTKHCSTNSFMYFKFQQGHETSVPTSPICVGMLEIRNCNLHYSTIHFCRNFILNKTDSLIRRNFLK